MIAQQKYDEAVGRARGWLEAANYCLNWAVDAFKAGNDERAKAFRELHVGLEKNFMSAKDNMDRAEKALTTKPQAEHDDHDSDF